MAQIINAVTNGNRPDLESIGREVPDGVKLLVQRCCAQDENDRPHMQGKIQLIIISVSRNATIYKRKMENFPRVWSIHVDLTTISSIFLT